MLPDGDQQQAVLGQALHGTQEYIRQPQSIALLVRLTPRQIGREEAIVPVQLPTIILTSALLRTVLCVGREQRREGRESGHQEINTHRVARADAVLYHREQVQRPKGQIRFAQLPDV